ncbi:MAG: patatin-like phospholipase family protein [Proteobacteria bacterium]|nr:patatin-like phospholipase family protein [Pseudomonadota bacterium]
MLSPATQHKQVKKPTAEAKQSLKAKMLSTPKKTWVFEGGGAKGLSYAGAIKVAEQRGMLKIVERVAGSSAGGITAFLLATGHSAAEIEKIMMELDLLETLQDPTPFIDGLNKTTNFVNETAKYTVPVYGLARYLIDKELPLHVGDAYATLHSLVDSCFVTGRFKGAWKGERFLAKAREMLKQKIGKESISFADLHALKLAHPELGLKDLYLTGTDVETNESVIFSHENPETKDVDIIDALRATMSFPFAFEAHEITINGKKRKFIDGGVKNNYPMDIFDLQDADGHRIPNPEVLGFKIDDKKECRTILFDDSTENKTHNIGKFTAISHDGDVNALYQYNTVQIFDADVWTLNFDLDNLTKLILKLSGEQAMQEFLKHGHQKHAMDSNELVTTLMKIGYDINDRKYLDAQKGLMLIQTKYPEVAAEVAKIVIDIINEFKIPGLKPGATEAYGALFNEAHRIANVKPQTSQVLPAIRDSLCAAGAVGAPLLLAGALNPLTAPLIPVAAGTVLLFKFIRSRKGDAPQVQVYTKEDVKKLITEHYFKDALELIRTNIENLTIADVTDLKKHLTSLATKGFWNQTRVEYDTLNNFLDVQIRAKTDVDAMIASFEKLCVTK